MKRYDRLLWLEREAAATCGPLTERVAKLLARYQRHQLTDPEHHIEAPVPGYLGCQDTYFVRTLRGVGRIYAQAFSKDKDFYAFYRRMEAYKQAFGAGGSTMILSPDTDFFRYFNDPAGPKK